ncbi:hypothetical protein [Rhizobacter sp. OV335]|uniref:hypothetical protein n=1 Tax=Rhizobacter sp. OV335 TaxID=1500264 RepID=UPI000917CFEA|nr:hypothetical protein [Rhizobacter sp. OV335]SHN39940.1 hypothetical protein SAMN02787076_06143 [Rhizobacter sp. OV335]
MGTFLNQLSSLEGGAVNQRRAKHFLARSIRKQSLLILSVSLAGLVGCGKKIEEAKWSEEVRLHDGRMIVIERVARANPQPFLSEIPGADIDFEIHYAPLNIHWKGGQLASLEIFDGNAYVVTAEPGGVEFCKGKPTSTLPIKVWRQQAGEWVEVDAANFPTDVALWNLYLKYWGGNGVEDAKGLITWEFKAGRDAYPFASDKGGNARRPATIMEHYVSKGITCARWAIDQK